MSGEFLARYGAIAYVKVERVAVDDGLRADLEAALADLGARMTERGANRATLVAQMDAIELSLMLYSPKSLRTSRKGGATTLPLNNSSDELFLDTEIEDSQLRMLFACCHPALAPEGQIALILKTLCGLSVPEIAAAFLTSPDNIEKRLYRTREKIRQERIALEVPLGAGLPSRLDEVLKAIYLLFNEGYHSASSDEVIRRELCNEAIRLTDLLAGHPVAGLPKTHALLSLLCFQASRFDARIDAGGQIVLLETRIAASGTKR